MASSEIGGSVKNPGRIGEIKRTIARINTALSSKESAGGKNSVKMAERR